MRTPLKNLIRIHGWEVDEARRKLNDLLAVQNDLRSRLERLDEEVRREQALAYENPESAVFYGAYADGVIQRRERLTESIRKMDAEVAVARETVRAAFRELKKYEVAQEARDLEEKQERDKREQAALDEMGLMRSVRGRGMA